MIFEQNSKEKEILKMCRFCFMCRHACPVFLVSKKDSNTARGHALLISKIDEGLSDWTDDVIDKMYECPQCHLCRELCDFHWEEDLLIQKIREYIVGIDKVPGNVKNIASKFIKNGSIYDKTKIKADIKEICKVANNSHNNGSSNSSSNNNHHNNNNNNNNNNLDVLYFAGSTVLYENPEILEKTGLLLNSVGVHWGMMEDETQTGIELFELGYKTEAKKAAKELVAKIMEINPEIIISGNPHILNTFKNLYLQWGIDELKDIKIYHISEYLDGIIKDRKIDPVKKNGNTLKVSYHDPCILGREMGIYDAPREIIKSVTGSYPIELFHNKREAECCGAGSVMNLTHPDLAGKVAKKRLESVLEEGCKILITGCPNCKNIFKNVIIEYNYDLDVLDIIELVALQVDFKNGKILD